MVKLMCLMCGQVWYSAYPGGKCDYCQGQLVVANEDNSKTAGLSSNIISLPAKRAARKLTKRS